MLGVSQSRGLKLFGREIIFEEFQPMCSRYLNVTDRQTDGQLTVASPCSALASRGKKRKKHTIKLHSTKMYITYTIITPITIAAPLPHMVSFQTMQTMTLNTIRHNLETNRFLWPTYIVTRRNTLLLRYSSVPLLQTTFRRTSFSKRPFGSRSAAPS